MYLDSFSYPMPTGHITIRQAENNFKRQTNERFKQAYYWLSYEMHKRNIFIQHQFNGGELYIPPYRVDGFDEMSNTIYEYNGCKYIYLKCQFLREKLIIYFIY